MSRTFIFRSPFVSHPGFEEGDRGTLLRKCEPPEVDPEIQDLWVARNERTGQEAQVWAGEAWTEDGKPLMPDYAFVGWTPEASEKGARA